MERSILSQIDSIAEEGIRLKAYPGCHVMILQEGLGLQQSVSVVIPMRVGTGQGKWPVVTWPL